MLYHEIVIKLLAGKMGYSYEAAEQMVITHKQVILNGIKSGAGYRETAIALEIEESKDVEHTTD